MSQVHRLTILLNGAPQSGSAVELLSGASQTTALSASSSTTPEIITTTTATMVAEPTVVQIHNMLLYICTELTINETEFAVANWRANLSSSASSTGSSSTSSSSSPVTPPASKEDPVQQLSKLGKFLEDIFRNKPPVSRVVTKDVIGKGSRYLFDEVRYSLSQIAHCSNNI